MRTRHRRTLERVFTRPVPSDLRWAEIEALLRAVGVVISERTGSRVGLVKDDKRIVIHKPHPGPEVGRATVRTVSRFLEDIGVES